MLLRNGQCVHDQTPTTCLHYTTVNLWQPPALVQRVGLPALIAKSTAYMQNTAKVSTAVLAYSLTSTCIHPGHRHPRQSSRLTRASSVITSPTISAAHPIVRKHAATMSEPAIIYGRLRPHLSVDESDIVPMIGCTINPDKGGAMKTRDVWVLARPNWRRYGVKSVASPSAPRSRTMMVSKRGEGRAGHLNGPGESASTCSALGPPWPP